MLVLVIMSSKEMLMKDIKISLLETVGLDVGLSSYQMRRMSVTPAGICCNGSVNPYGIFMMSSWKWACLRVYNKLKGPESGI